MHGFKATDIAWSLPVSSSSERLVLLALARYANDEMICYPSVSAIAGATKLNQKTVFSAIKGLRDKGFIAVSHTGKNNANTYTITSSTENGTTENGTTENGTTENGTTGTPKNGRTGTTENGIRTYQLTNQLTDQEALPPSPPPARRKTLTHIFDIQELPQEWREYCEEVRPDLNPDKVFCDFRFYWSSGRGSGTRRSDKGWNQSWQTWVRKEKENGKNKKQDPATADLNSIHYTADMYNDYLGEGEE